MGESRQARLPRSVADPTTGSAICSGDIVRRWERNLTDTKLTRIVGKRTSSLRRGGHGLTASFSFSYFLIE